MLKPTGRASLWAGLALLICGTAYAANATIDATLAGWTPVVTLWGGEVHGAVKTLDKITRALSAAIHHYEIDEATQAVIDDVLKELENFDLDGLYNLLPDERDGGREVNVKGVLAGDTYRIGHAEPGGASFVGMSGPRNALADFSLFVHAKQKDGKDHDTLLLRGNAGLGLGPLSYRAATEAQRELLRIVTTSNPAADATEPLPTGGLAREAVREKNPGLGDEDLDALALLFDAYPMLGRALIELGRVEDVRAPLVKGSYYHITTVLRAEPDRMAVKYPALARYNRRLADVLKGEMQVLDDQGRTLMRGTVNSQKLRATLELYVKDGQILPFKGQRVFEDEPLDPLGDTLTSPKLVIDARINMLGVVVTLKDLEVDAHYEAHDSYVLADASVTNMPDIVVSGRALGVFSPGFLDIFIPSNIQDITEEFFRVAFKGNGGKGANGHGEFGAKTAGAPGVIAGAGSVEIMDTFLVKLAGSLVSHRLMIDDEEKNEAIQLAGDLHDAFKVDFAKFKKRVSAQ
jgi:hypothetical protein